jgi:tetratricopeptide (TPR) repeat protein
MPGSRIKNFLFCLTWAGFCLALPVDALAVGYEFVAVENLFVNPPQAMQAQPGAIVITSSRQRFESLPGNTRRALQDYFVYQTRVRVNGTIYFRLVVGNYRNAIDAEAVLNKLKPTFANAWVYIRTEAERQGLDAFLKNVGDEERVEPDTIVPETAELLLARARQQFIDQDYTRVITTTDRILNQGSLDQVRAALELAGTARERQGKYAQAISLYETLLDTDPPPEEKARIASRLEGIRTMSLDPKARLPGADREADENNWILRGALQQYYRNDVIDRPRESSEEVNEVLVTDVDLQIQRRREADTLSFEIDAGLVADLLEDQSDNRISSASVDGFTYADLSHSGYQTSYFLGTLAQSPYEGIESDNPLIGANLDFDPYEWLDVNLYLINQEVSGLTDRQAIGSEFQLRSDLGFVYGIIDYDVFYEDLNNLTFITNYRYDPQWSFNLTLARVNAPTLTTASALQGQSAKSIDELKDIFTDDEIYQLAQDRTSISNSLYFVATHSLDSDRQLNFDFSYFDLDATTNSGGVEAIPPTEELQVSFGYSAVNFFSSNDYTTMGVRLSDSDTSEIQSFRLRSRFAGKGGITYDPRVQLDFRRSESSGLDQIILRPAIKLKYRTTRKLHLEGDFSIEYSDLDLPDFDQQIAYSLYVGYIYYF